MDKQAQKPFKLYPTSSFGPMILTPLQAYYDGKVIPDHSILLMECGDGNNQELSHSKPDVVKENYQSMLEMDLAHSNISWYIPNTENEIRTATRRSKRKARLRILSLRKNGLAW